MKQLTKKKLFAGALTLGALSLIALPAVVGATPLSEGCGSGVGQVPCAESLGLGQASLSSMITQIMTLIMSLLGIIAVLIILWGGFIWMTAAGEPDKVEKAKKLIYAGIIGLVIIFAAYAIASFVISNMRAFSQASAVVS